MPREFSFPSSAVDQGSCADPGAAGTRNPGLASARARGIVRLLARLGEWGWVDRPSAASNAVDLGWLA